MATIEKLVPQIKQLPLHEKEILLGILRQETEANRSVNTSALQSREATPPNSKDEETAEPELKWLMDNGWVLEKYRGEYLALKGYELIAHGSLGEVLAASRRRGIEQPFTQYLPKTEREWLLGQGNYSKTDA